MLAARRRRTRAPRPADAPSPWPFVGMAAMAGLLFLEGAAALLAPWWAVTALVASWCVLFVLCVRWWTPHPTRLPWVALGGFLVWFAVLLLGGLALGWSTVG